MYIQSVMENETKNQTVVIHMTIHSNNRQKLIIIDYNQTFIYDIIIIVEDFLTTCILRYTI